VNVDTWAATEAVIQGVHEKLHAWFQGEDPAMAFRATGGFQSAGCEYTSHMVGFDPQFPKIHTTGILKKGQLGPEETKTR